MCESGYCSPSACQMIHYNLSLCDYSLSWVVTFEASYIYGDATQVAIPNLHLENTCRLIWKTQPIELFIRLYHSSCYTFVFPSKPIKNKSGNLSQNTPVWDMVNVLRNMYMNFTKRPSSRYNFRSCLVKIGLKLFELESRQLTKCLKCTKWPCDLVFVLEWPIFELDLDIIDIQLLTRFGEDRIKTIWIRVRTPCWTPPPAAGFHIIRPFFDGHIKSMQSFMQVYRSSRFLIINLWVRWPLFKEPIVINWLQAHGCTLFIYPHGSLDNKTDIRQDYRQKAVMLIVKKFHQNPHKGFESRSTCSPVPDTNTIKTENKIKKKPTVFASCQNEDFHKKREFNLSHADPHFWQTTLSNVFVLFPWKLSLTFHSNCLQRRQFEWNVQLCFQVELRRVPQFDVCFCCL